MVKASIQGSEAASSSNGKMALAIFLFLLGVYLLTGAFRIDSGDGEAMYQVTRSILQGGDLAIPPPEPGTTVIDPNGNIVSVEELPPDGWWPYGAWGEDGRYYSKYGLGWSLAAIPFYLLGSVTAQFVPWLEVSYASRAAVTLVDTLAISLAGALLYLLARRFYENRVAGLIALGYGLGSIVWAYARGTFSEPLVALGLLWAILTALRAAERVQIAWWVLSGVGLGGALLCRPAAAVMTLPVAAWALRAGFQRAKLRGMAITAIAFGIPVVLALATLLGYNVIRFGDPLDMGYPQSVWSPEPFVGLYGMLLSPGKGLFLFVPLTLVALAGWPRFVRRYPVPGWPLLAMIVLQVGLYSFTLRDWDGGASWGPRHLVPVLAFVLLPAGEVLQRAHKRRLPELTVALLLAASVVIQLLGISANTSRHLQRVFATYQDFPTYFQRVNFTWTDSPLPGQFRSLLEMRTVLQDPKRRGELERVAAALGEGSNAQVQKVTILSFNVPDFWFVYWRSLGAGLLGLIAAGGVLATWAALTFLWLRRIVTWGNSQLQTRETEPIVGA